ncbi:MAG: cation:proton antiporter [Lactobacillaceae bacterium]|jgi:monovalent cation:proton antiporter-2 (CPA2) family protein|nr:cation:proton antiporter [Lactobacillaceae bacterium]
MSELTILAIMIFASVISGEIAIRIKIPSVIGPLLVGVLLGPSLLNVVHHDKIITFLSEIGVMGLMFIAGLESDLHLLKKFLKPSLLAALLGSLIPAAVFFAFCQLSGTSVKSSLFYGIVFAATSTSITLNVLKERGKMQSKNGITIVGSAIVDDILAMLTLGIYIAIFVQSSDGNSSSPIWAGLLLNLLFLILVAFVIRYLVPWIMHHWVPKLKNNNQINIQMGWFIMLFMAALAINFGLSAIIGAFFAGVAISQTDVKDEIEEATASSQYGFFIPIFLTSVGLEVNLAVINNWWIILLLTIFAVLTKFIGTGLGAKLAGYNLLDSSIVGAGSIPRGEFSIVIAQIGLTAKIINEEVYSEILVVVILATVIGPIILNLLFNKEDNRN